MKYWPSVRKEMDLFISGIKKERSEKMLAISEADSERLRDSLCDAMKTHTQGQ